MADKIDVRTQGGEFCVLWEGCATTGQIRKYPLENKLYHAAIIAAGLSAIITGVFMMSAYAQIFFPRNPYLFVI